MADKPHFTTQQMVDAIAKAEGIISVAAAWLGCQPNTVRAYVKRYPTVAAAITEAREGLKDVAEATVIQQIHDGDMDTIKWYLGKQAKDRGYGAEMTHKHGGDPNNPTPILISSITSVEYPRLTAGATDDDADGDDLDPA